MSFKNGGDKELLPTQFWKSQKCLFFYLYFYLEIVLIKVQYVLENCAIAHFKKDFKGLNFLI